MSNPIRILVVDDEPTVRLTLECAASEQDGWVLESVESAEVGLNRLEKQAFDLLVVDKNLPQMNGVEMIRRVRQTDRSVDVVMITGNASVESALETLNLGISGYIEKPFDDIYAVIEKLKKVLAARRMRKKVRHLVDTPNGVKGERSKLQDAARLNTAGQDVRVLIVTPIVEERVWMARQLAGSVTDIVCVAWPEEDAVTHARKQRPDIVIADMALTRPDPVAMIKQMLPFLPQANFAIVADKNPPLKVITALIDLHVRVILDKPLDAKIFREKVDHLVMLATQTVFG